MFVVTTKNYTVFPGNIHKNFDFEVTNISREYCILKKSYFVYTF